MKKFKITKGNRVYIVDAKSHIDAISKVKAVKTDKVRDSISQWKPGMSKIGLFQISYKKGTVNQSILVTAATKEDAINKFTKHQPNAEVIGVNEYPNPHFGEPILDSKMKDSGINYGTLIIDLTSPNELTAQKIVQELKNEIGNNKIAEIRGGSFTPVSEHSDGRLDLDFKEFKNNEWGTNHITLMVRSSLPFLMKTMKDDPKYGAYKLRAELNSKLKQFANKTIYSNKSFTMDSAIKDEDYSKYLSIVKQLEKLVEPANRALQQKIAKYGVTKQDIRNNSPKYRDVCREIPELKVWTKLIMQLPGELAGFMPAHPSQESVDKLKKAVTNSKAFDSTIK